MADGTALDCAVDLLSAGGTTQLAFDASRQTAGPIILKLHVSAVQPDTDPTNNDLTLIGIVLPCTIVGTYGNDVIHGTPRADRICALPGADRIYAGAGNGPYSPTSLIAETFPTATPPNFNSSTIQYPLANSDGSTWQNIDAAALSSTITPAASASAILTANVDLFTGKAGFNQDIGIFVSDNAGLDTLVAWKESGGFAGTFSPNAAFIKAIYPAVAGHTYVFKLKWKTNKPAAGATIYAGAGNGPYSPTSLRVSLFTGDTFSNSSTTQYHLTSSNGVTWTPIDAATNVTVTQGVSTNSVVGANVDLFTANAGFNQDIAIFVSDNGGADVLLAWKESGGFAGTFSPNAAFVQTTLQMTTGHTYVFKLKWKTNKNAPGATIYAAAGGPAPFSNTWLTVEPTDY